MNGKKVACVLLLIIVGIITYSGQIAHQKVVAKVKEADAAQEAANASRGSLETEKIITEKLRVESDELMRFVKAWEPHADRVQTQSEVEESLLASLRSANLYIASQKFEAKASNVSPLIPRIVRASLVLEDDYAKTLNWIGEMERRLPLARVMSCRITGGDNGRQVHAELFIEVPMVNLAYDPNDPKGTKAAAAAKAKGGKGKPGAKPAPPAKGKTA